MFSLDELSPSAMSAFVLLLSDEPTSGAAKTKRLIYVYTPWIGSRYCHSFSTMQSASFPHPFIIRTFP